MKLEDRFPGEKDLVRRAEEFARKAHTGQRRKSGEPFINHPLAVAEILAEEGLGAETIQAALLHDTIEDTPVTAEEVEREFGSAVGRLVQGITKIERATEDERRNETYRKMLLAAAEDARVLLIKIADRVHNMRTISALPEKSQERVARETLAVYTPIAHRLGLRRLQQELENRSLAVLHPEEYRQAELLQRERRASGSKEMRRLQGQIRRALRAADIENFRLESRVKSIYSIADKMRRREGTEIWDVLGIRIILSSRADCYRALGVVHQIWKPLPEHFDDYIAVPRGGLYRSLHTTVMTERGRAVEVQIRSEEMNKLAEHGLAAHWLYKEDLRQGGPQSRYINQAASGMRGNSLEDLFRDLREETFSEEIYLFTPNGDIRFLPEGSTAIDFAYAIHSEIGSHIGGARVDGKLFPLHKPLPPGSQVEIITRPGAEPTEDWLQSVKSTKARSRIRAFLASKSETDRGEEGLERIASGLRGAGLAPLADNLWEALEVAGYTDSEEVGRRALRDKSLLREIIRNIARANGQRLAPAAPRKHKRDEEIEIEGMDGVLLRRAGCCSPLPGDNIIGYVSLGRGVSVHRQDCSSVKDWQKTAPERLLDARWRDESRVLRLRLSYWAKDTDPSELLLLLEGVGNEIEHLDLERQGDIFHADIRLRLADRDSEEILLAELRNLPGAIEK